MPFVASSKRDWILSEDVANALIAAKNAPEVLHTSGPFFGYSLRLALDAELQNGLGSGQGKVKECTMRHRTNGRTCRCRGGSPPAFHGTLGTIPSVQIRITNTGDIRRSAYAYTASRGQWAAVSNARLASALESRPSAAAEHLSSASLHAGPGLRACRSQVRACAGVAIVISKPSSFSRTGSFHWSVNAFSRFKSDRNNP